MKNPASQPKPSALAANASPELPPGRPKLSSRVLFGTQNEIVIEHQGDEYRLRITSNGKLILTK